MENLKEYGTGELSNYVFNDEGLYKQRHNKGFLNLLKDIFIYTREQKKELLQDLKEDKEEIKRFKNEHE